MRWLVIGLQHQSFQNDEEVLIPLSTFASRTAFLDVYGMHPVPFGQSIQLGCFGIWDVMPQHRSTFNFPPNDNMLTRPKTYFCVSPRFHCPSDRDAFLPPRASANNFLCLHRRIAVCL